MPVVMHGDPDRNGRNGIADRPGEAPRVRLLGPVEVGLGDQTIGGGPPQQRLVLAALAVDAGRPVTVETLIDRVWDEAPPGARRTLYVHVNGVRRLLRAGQRVAGESLVRRRSGGYLLDVSVDGVDVHRFHALLADARDAEPHERVRPLREALGLWRGEPLAGLPGQWAARTRAAWRQEYLDAVVGWVGAELAGGDPGSVLGPLTALVGEHPMAESLVAALMRTLVALGRPADALTRYGQLRERLAEELGTDPAPDIRALYQAILRGEDVLPRTRARVAEPAVPAQLPADVVGFTGRDEYLSHLDGLLAVYAHRPAAVVISAIAGTPGVGKSALAVHWAHRVAHRFPDGQLYVNLRGFDPSGQAMVPAEAARGFLDAFGVAPERIPAGLDAQAALYRSLLVGKRVLVVLDNARDAEQVRPLLPAAGGCLAVVTSRNQLTGLVATDGAHPLALDLLADADARQLLTSRLGTRVAAEPGATDRIVACCAGLPLALAIVAARARQTGFPLGAIAEELLDARARLDALDAGDPASRVRAVFSWSYDALDGPAARLFRLLGLHPGPDISAAAAASLAGITPAQARPPLSELTRASLLTEHGPGRYSLHDLLRAYASELAEREETEDNRTAAVTRLLDHYTHTAYAASLRMEPVREPIPLPLRPAAPGTHPERPAGFREALAWFTAEHGVLLAAQRRAVEAGFDERAFQLAWDLDVYLDRQAHRHDLDSVWRTALVAADRLADPSIRAYTHRYLAHTESLFGDAHAAVHLRRAIELYRAAGDATGEAYIHNNLSVFWEMRGRYDRSLDHARQALALFRAAGHGRGEGVGLNAVAWALAHMGRDREALRHCARAIALLRDIGDRYVEAVALDTLAYAHHHLGHHVESAARYEEALAIFREFGDLHKEARVLVKLGDVHSSAGRADAAREAWQGSLKIFEEIGDPQSDVVRARLIDLAVATGDRDPGARADARPPP